MRALLFMLIASGVCALLAKMTPTDQPQLRLLRNALWLFAAFFGLLLLVAVVQALLGYE